MLLSKSVIVGYERHSETERVLVINEGLANLRWLKIQSAPLGNLGDLEGILNELEFKIKLI